VPQGDANTENGLGSSAAATAVYPPAGTTVFSVPD